MEKPLKVAAWSGLLSFILSAVIFLFVLTSPTQTPNVIASLVLSVAGGVLGLLYLNGFLVLGKKFNGKLLVVMAWIGIGFTIASLIFGVVGNLIGTAEVVSAQGSDFSIGAGGEAGFDDTTAALFIIFIIVWLVISVVAGTYSILFGIGLLKLKGKVQYAKTAAVLEIVAGATYIILVGILVKVVAYVFEIAMFFKASEKFEK